MNDVIVSIVCITYNHEGYIADAIESFLAQRTDFKYEILIHDDASTDGTARIIRKYAEQYSDIIKPIFQKENQYSKGAKVSDYLLERAVGKYIAVCEGDDYWISLNKLQKQVDYLDRNPECSVCVHAALRVSPNKKRKIRQSRPNMGNKVFTVEEVIEREGGLFPTASFVYRRELAISRPAFYYNSPVGDYPLIVFLALQGSVYYLDERLSAYRVNVKGSWTDRLSRDRPKMADVYLRRCNMLDELNRYTGKKYENSIRKTKHKNQFKYLLEQGDYPKILEEFDSLDRTSKMRMALRRCSPSLYERLLRIWKAL